MLGKIIFLIIFACFTILYFSFTSFAYGYTCAEKYQYCKYDLPNACSSSDNCSWEIQQCWDEYVNYDECGTPPIKKERFEFDIDVQTFAYVGQNDIVSIPIEITPIKGEPQVVNLWTGDWSSVGISAWIEPSAVSPDNLHATLIVQTRNTPSDQYIFEIHGSTAGTMFTSVDSVTVTVEDSDALLPTDKALQFYQDKNYQVAITMFNEILEANPDDVIALMGKGSSLRELGNYDEAITIFSKILDIEPNNTFALNEIGQIFYYQEEYDTALFYFKKAQSIEPDNEDHRYNVESTMEKINQDNVGVPTKCSGSIINFDSTIYSINDSIDITIISPDVNKSPEIEEAVIVDVISGGSSRILSISETSQDTGIFSTSVKIHDFISSDSDDIVVRYFDSCENKYYEEKISIVSDNSLDDKNGGGCLIATATYGTELAPQVQQLREIRDSTLLQTNSGSAFMTGFNTFYHSFSPTIADLERQNPAFKQAVKLTITPLLSSLSLLQYVDVDSEAEMLGYGIGIILLNIGMYFVGPAFLIVGLKSKFSKIYA